MVSCFDCGVTVAKISTATSERSRAALSSTLRYSNQNSGGGSEHPYNMAWGDDDGKTLYLTAQTSLYRIRLNIPGVRPKLAASK